MRLHWLTGRRLDSDLASSTEIGLFHALKSRGFDIRLHYPGEEFSNSLKSEGIFPSLNNSSIKGLKSKSASKSATSIIREASRSSNCIILIDWRLVPWLGSELAEFPYPWFMVDRGPPADDTILGKLQWRYWIKSWRIARDSASGGVVVSNKHEQIARQYSGENLPFCQIGGGVRRLDISSTKTKRDDKQLNLTYIGRLDRSRGVLDLLKILDWAEKQELILEIHVAGTGDESDTLLRDPRIIHHGVLNSRQVPNLLSKCDVGLLPMPRTKVWVTSSPLKLSEYAAAGLAVVGVDHPGHVLSDSSSWMELGAPPEWWAHGIQRFSQLSKKEWDLIHKSATTAADQFTFDSLAEKLESFINSLI